MSKVNQEALYRLYVAIPGATTMSEYRLDTARYGWEIDELLRVERIYREGGYHVLVLSMRGGIDRVIRGERLAA